MKHEVNEPSFKDPVCGMQVSRTTVVDELDYQGKSYYFCASVCRESFEAGPSRYIRPHHIQSKTLSGPKTELTRFHFGKA